jgi:hypothetical protein
MIFQILVAIMHLFDSQIHGRVPVQSQIVAHTLRLHLQLHLLQLAAPLLRRQLPVLHQPPVLPVLEHQHVLHLRVQWLQRMRELDAQEQGRLMGVGGLEMPELEVVQFGAQLGLLQPPDVGLEEIKSVILINFK